MRSDLDVQQILDTENVTAPTPGLPKMTLPAAAPAAPVAPPPQTSAPSTPKAESSTIPESPQPTPDGLQKPLFGADFTATKKTISQEQTKSSNYLKDSQNSYNMAAKELEELPPGLSAEYRTQLEHLDSKREEYLTDFRRVRDSNLDAYEKGKAYANIAKIAELISLNMVKVLAGIHGIKDGKDYASGVDFRFSDWSKEMEGLREELRVKDLMAKDELNEQLGFLKEQRETVRKEGEEGRKGKIEAIRDRMKLAQADVAEAKHRAGELQGKAIDVSVREAEAGQRAKEKSADYDLELKKIESMTSSADKSAMKMQNDLLKAGLKELNDKYEAEEKGLNTAIANIMSKDSSKRDEGKAELLSVFASGGVPLATAAAKLKKAESWWAGKLDPAEAAAFHAEAKNALIQKYNNLKAEAMGGRTQPTTQPSTSLPTKNIGNRIRDDVTGKEYNWDGSKYVEVK